MVATRPRGQNGLGVPPKTAFTFLNRFRNFLPMLPDTPAVHGRWEELVSRHEVSGKTAHDARLVALMLVHGLDTIVTFNDSDFKRYNEIVALRPRDVA